MEGVIKSLLSPRESNNGHTHTTLTTHTTQHRPYAIDTSNNNTNGVKHRPTPWHTEHTTQHVQHVQQQQQPHNSTPLSPRKFRSLSRADEEAECTHNGHNGLMVTPRHTVVGAVVNSKERMKLMENFVIGKNLTPDNANVIGRTDNTLIYSVTKPVQVHNNPTLPPLTVPDTPRILDEYGQRSPVELGMESKFRWSLASPRDAQVNKVQQLEAEMKRKADELAYSFEVRLKSEADRIRKDYAHDAVLVERLHKEELNTLEQKYARQFQTLLEKGKAWQDSQRAAKEQKREIERLHAELKAISERLNQTSNQNDMLKNQLNKLANHNRSLEDKVHSIETENETLKRESESLKREREREKMSKSRNGVNVSVVDAEAEEAARQKQKHRAEEGQDTRERLVDSQLSSDEKAKLEREMREKFEKELNKQKAKYELELHDLMAEQGFQIKNMKANLESARNEAALYKQKLVDFESLQIANGWKKNYEALMRDYRALEKVFRKEQKKYEEQGRNLAMDMQEALKFFLRTEEFLRSDLTCPKCLDTLTQPVLIHPCGHTVCRKCFLELRDPESKKYICENCRLDDLDNDLAHDDDDEDPANEEPLPFAETEVDWDRIPGETKFVSRNQLATSLAAKYAWWQVSIKSVTNIFTKLQHGHGTEVPVEIKAIAAGRIQQCWRTRKLQRAQRSMHKGLTTEFDHIASQLNANGFNI